MPAWVTPLIRILVSLVEEIRRKRRQAHIDAVRADPAGEWVREFGGTDKRANSSGSADSGGNSDR